jgi:hypothetical protein
MGGEGVFGLYQLGSEQSGCGGFVSIHSCMPFHKVLKRLDRSNVDFGLVTRLGSRLCFLFTDPTRGSRAASRWLLGHMDGAHVGDSTAVGGVDISNGNFPCQCRNATAHSATLG